MIKNKAYSRENLLAGIHGKIPNFVVREFLASGNKFYKKWYVSAPHPSVRNVWIYLLDNGTIDTSTGRNYEGFFDSQELAEQAITAYLQADSQ